MYSRPCTNGKIVWVSFWESYLSISIYHLTGFFFQSTNELRWRFFVYCPSHSTYLNYFFEQTKRETTCEIKARHSHHSPKKKMFGFCFGFFWDGRAFSVWFFVFLWNFHTNVVDTGQWIHTHCHCGGGVFTHLLLLLLLLFASFDLVIFWQSICQASLYISGMEKRYKAYNYHTLRF